jgi:hypothetical protein
LALACSILPSVHSAAAGQEAAKAAEPTAPAIVQAQTEPSERVSIGTSLITPIFGAYLLEANASITDHWALLINASSLVFDNADWRTTSRTLGIGGTYNWRGTGLRGWYTGVTGELMFSSWTHQPSGQRADMVLGYNAIVGSGYRFIWDAGPMLDLGVGAVVLHFPSAKVVVDGETVRSKAMTQVYPAVNVTVGWAF